VRTGPYLCFFSLKSQSSPLQRAVFAYFEAGFYVPGVFTQPLLARDISPVMSFSAAFDSKRPLARQRFRLDLTLQLTPLSPLFRHLNTTDFDSVDGLNQLDKGSQEVPILLLMEVANVHMRPFK
jgi:hypothetical protein